MRFAHWIAAAAFAASGACASASTVTLFANFTLEGANSPSGSGTALVVFDPSDNTLDFDVQFSGLSSPTTVAHIHCCTALPFVGNAGVVVEPPSLENFPSGVLAGHYVQTIDLDDPGNVNQSFINLHGSLAAAISALIAGLSDGHGYFNIHTQANPGGEIRARLQAIPEPASLTLALLALAALAGSAGRRRQ